MKAKALPQITQVLVRRVFAAYLGVAILLTGLHVLVQYRATYDNMVKQFDTVARAFTPTVSVALWNYQDDVLQSVAKGFLEEPAIRGVSIHELSGNEVLSVGQVKEIENPQDISRSYPIYAPGSRNKIFIGTMKIHSTHAEVMARFQSAMILLLFSAALKTAALWLIISYFSNQLLAKPLLRFAQQISMAKRAGGIDTQNVDLGPVPTDELSSLTSAMDQLIAKVIAHERLLQQVAKALERRVAGLDDQKIAIDDATDSGLANAAVRPEVYLAMREAFPEVLVWVALWDSTVIHSPVAVTRAARDASPASGDELAINAPISLLDFVSSGDVPAMRRMLDQVREKGEAVCQADVTLHDERLVRCRFIARTVVRNDLSFIVVLSFDQLKHEGRPALLDPENWSL